MKAIDYRERCADLESIISMDAVKHDREIAARDARIAELEAALESMTNARDEYARLARAYLIRLQVTDPDGYGNVKAVDL